MNHTVKFTNGIHLYLEALRDILAYNGLYRFLHIFNRCTFSHPVEEIGMGGATDLDVFDLEGKRFLNMDTEEEGYLMVSCCGGRRMRMYLPVERVAASQDKKTYAIRIRGLKGGHSGADIHLQRASANVLMGRLLLELREEFDYEHCKGCGICVKVCPFGAITMKGVK